MCDRTVNLDFPFATASLEASGHMHQINDSLDLQWARASPFRFLGKENGRRQKAKAREQHAAIAIPPRNSLRWSRRSTYFHSAWQNLPVPPYCVKDHAEPVARRTASLSRKFRFRRGTSECQET